MAKPRDLKVVSRDAPRSGRRTLLKGLVAGAGAGLGIPGLAESHPMAEHAHHPGRIAAAQADAAESPEAPAFLDDHQFATLESLSEAIVPGAAAAGCARFIDSLLNVSEGDDRQELLSALGALEARARERFSAPWTSLSDAQRQDLLIEVSTAAPGREPRYWTPGTPVMEHLASASGPAPLTLRDQFDVVKGWVVGSYYSSEAGMRELGWEGPIFAETFPGCSHPDGHE